MITWSAFCKYGVWRYEPRRHIDRVFDKLLSALFPCLSCPSFRLAAAGSTEALEAIRASESTSGSSRALSAASSGSADADGVLVGEASDRGGSGGSLTPLTVLPVLLVLVAAGYCAVNDLLPLHRLSSIGGGGGTGVAPGNGPTAAKSGSRRAGLREDGAQMAEAPGTSLEGGLDASREGGPRWQQRGQQQSPPGASPVLKTLVRSATPVPSAAPASVGMSAAAPSAAAAPPTGTSVDRWLDGKVGPEGSQGGATSGARLGQKWGWGWGVRADATNSQDSRQEGEGAESTMKLSDDEDGEIPREDEAQQQPLWMQRWRAPAASRSS